MSQEGGLILLIESSSKNCSVALTNGKELLCLRELSNEAYIHAENLHEFIEQVFTHSGKKYSELKAVAVSKGPGSYTGLRIGVSAAKGFCMALDIPLIAVSTTEILARYGKKTFSHYAYYIAMIDARRDEVYTAIYDYDLQLINEVKSEIVNPEYLSRFKNERALFIGDGADKCRLSDQNQNVLSVLPSATMMVESANERFESEKFEDTAYFEPFYLKDFIPGKAKSTVL